MKVTYDLYAETNPAFIAYLLQRFVLKYCEKSEVPPHISLAYIAIPISLTGMLEGSFSATRSTTGFLPWLSRFPEVRIGLHSNVAASKDLTSKGLTAGVQGGLLRIADGCNLTLGGTKRPPENLKSKLPESPKACVARAERLGGWMASAGKPATIFSALEIQP
jgi:hypothetical protein